MLGLRGSMISSLEFRVLLSVHSVHSPTTSSAGYQLAPSLSLIGPACRLLHHVADDGPQQHMDISGIQRHKGTIVYLNESNNELNISEAILEVYRTSKIISKYSIHAVQKTGKEFLTVTRASSPVSASYKEVRMDGRTRTTTVSRVCSTFTRQVEITPIQE